MFRLNRLSKCNVFWIPEGGPNSSQVFKQLGKPKKEKKKKKKTKRENITEEIREKEAEKLAFRQKYPSAGCSK